jgi:hypothetical protein
MLRLLGIAILESSVARPVPVPDAACDAAESDLFVVLILVLLFVEITNLLELTAGSAHDTSTGTRAVLRSTMFSAR